jgi:hypothetical protein
MPGTGRERRSARLCPDSSRRLQYSRSLPCITMLPRRCTRRRAAPVSRRLQYNRSLPFITMLPRPCTRRHAAPVSRRLHYSRSLHFLSTPGALGGARKHGLPLLYARTLAVADATAIAASKASRGPRRPAAARLSTTAVPVFLWGATLPHSEAAERDVVTLDVLPDRNLKLSTVSLDQRLRPIPGINNAVNREQSLGLRPHI